jgi:hypothetical protein
MSSVYQRALPFGVQAVHGVAVERAWAVTFESGAGPATRGTCSGLGSVDGVAEATGPEAEGSVLAVAPATLEPGAGERLGLGDSSRSSGDVPDPSPKSPV